MSKIRVCFDTSAWNALLNNETDKDVDSLKAWMARGATGEAVLLVPAIVVCEAYCTPNREKLEVFENVLKRTGVESLDITLQLAREGGLLRRKVRNDGMNIKTPDAMVVVSACHHLADFLITCDERHMLRMNGMYDLRPTIGLPSTGFNQDLFEHSGI